MDRRLADISNSKSYSNEFLYYLKSNIGIEAFSFLDELSRFAEVHIFSGVIRNFFLNYRGKIRDLDIVIKFDESLMEFAFRAYSWKRNSFGGYKVEVGNLTFDIWHISNTWAYSEKKVSRELFEHYSLPNTVFFNFSSVVFDFNNKEFVYTPTFKRFLETRELDLVLEENPLPHLCIVNTFYYKHKYFLGVSKELQKYCINHFEKYNEDDFEKIQRKHFNDVIYPYHYIKEYLKVFAKNLGEKDLGFSVNM